MSSSVYQDFVFSEPVNPSNVSIKVEVLKWDHLELQLYQVVFPTMLFHCFASQINFFLENIFFRK